MEEEEGIVLVRNGSGIGAVGEEIEGGKATQHLKAVSLILESLCMLVNELG